MVDILRYRTVRFQVSKDTLAIIFGCDANISLRHSRTPPPASIFPHYPAVDQVGHTPRPLGNRVRPLKPLTPLTIEQCLTYTGVSALIVGAYDTDGICGGTTPYFRCFLLLLATLLLVQLQISHALQALRDSGTTEEVGMIVDSAVLVGILFSSGWVVDSVESWVTDQPERKKAVGMEETEQEMDLLQMKALHFSLAWWIVSETEYWRLRLLEKYKNVKYPEYFFIPMDNTWVPRLFPWHHALQHANIVHAANSTFWSHFRTASVWKVSLLDSGIMFPWFLHFGRCTTLSHTYQPEVYGKWRDIVR